MCRHRAAPPLPARQRRGAARSSPRPGIAGGVCLCAQRQRCADGDADIVPRPSSLRRGWRNPGCMRASAACADGLRGVGRRSRGAGAAAAAAAAAARAASAITAAAEDAVPPMPTTVEPASRRRCRWPRRPRHLGPDAGRETASSDDNACSSRFARTATTTRLAAAAAGGAASAVGRSLGARGGAIATSSAGERRVPRSPSSRPAAVR